MSHIPPVDYATAGEAVRAEHDRELALRGRMTNMKRVLLHSPVAHRIYAEWFTLREELRPVLDDRAIWLFSHAIAQASKAPVPVGFFRRALIGAGLNPDTLQPTADERLLIRFGEAIVADSSAVPDALWDDLKRRYETVALVNLVAFAGIMLATAMFTNVVDIELDPELLPFLAAATPAAGEAP